MEVKYIRVDIVDVALEINDLFVELTVKDPTNHMIKIDLDEINVNKWILDEAWSNTGLDNNPAVEGFSPDEMHSQLMHALYDYLVHKDNALLGLSGIGIKLCSCDNI